MKTFEQFVSGNKVMKYYTFIGECFVRNISEYLLGEKKFKSDFIGLHGGDQFDFHISDALVMKSEYENEEVTRIHFNGYFELSEKYKEDELTNFLTEYVGDVIESFTQKYPQMLEITISKE